MPRHPSPLVAALFLAFLPAGSGRAEIVQDQPTTVEIAGAMGLHPFCANLRFDKPCYARLQADVTDAQGGTSHPHVTPGQKSDHFRIRVFFFEDPQTHKPLRLSFNLSPDDDVAANMFLDFPKEARGACLSLMRENDRFYEITAYGRDPHDVVCKIALRIITSETPFPMPGSAIKVLELHPAVPTPSVKPKP
jgi:hypothetical protein